MKAFEEIYQIVEESSHETAFNKEECQALYDLVDRVPDNGIVVEIGVEYGRSTSVIAEVKKEHRLDFYAIDPYTIQDNGTDAKDHVKSQMEKHEWKFNLWEMTSEEASAKFPHKGIDLLHIDGDHTYEGVTKDINLWAAKVKKDGFMLFDDYGHDSLPGVFQAVTEYMSKNGGWHFEGRFGNKLGVFKKL